MNTERSTSFTISLLAMFMVAGCTIDDSSENKDLISDAEQTDTDAQVECHYWYEDCRCRQEDIGLTCCDGGTNRTYVCNGTWKREDDGGCYSPERDGMLDCETDIIVLGHQETSP